MPEYRARGTGELQRVADLIRSLSPEKPWRITLTAHKAKRSGEQNRLLWAIYTEMAAETGHTPEEIHEAMKLKFLPMQTVTVGDTDFHMPASSTRLDVAAFSDFVTRVQAFAASELGIVV